MYYCTTLKCDKLFAECQHQMVNRMGQNVLSPLRAAVRAFGRGIQWQRKALTVARLGKGEYTSSDDTNVKLAENA